MVEDVERAPDRRRENLVQGLGAFPVVSLAQARSSVHDLRQQLAGGSVPGRRADVPTFEQAAERLIAQRRQKWAGGGDREKRVRSLLRRFVFPHIGGMRVDAIEATDVLRVLDPLFGEGHHAAKDVRALVRATLGLCQARQHIESNPAGEGIDAAFVGVTKVPNHFRALAHRRVVAALSALGASGAELSTKLCIRFLILTVARTGEARLAKWSEIDLEKRVWRLPEHRMKMKREHVQPLSRAACGILAEARLADDGSGFVFPSPRGGDRPLAEPSLRTALRRAGLAPETTVHGLRSTFRDWAAECTDAEHAIIELCMAHAVGKLEAAYARSELLAKRAELMERWARYVTGEPRPEESEGVRRPARAAAGCRHGGPRQS